MDFCGPFDGPQRLDFTAELSQVLSSVNSEVNDRYRFRADSGAYGTRDYWTVPMGNAADCEDYVLAKILALRERGIAVSALVILIGPLGDGRWHATLGVQTDRGTVLLDLSGRDVGTVQSIGMNVQFYLAMSDSRQWRVAG